jgi:hypothetical protein
MSPKPALFPILSTVVTNLRATAGYGNPTTGSGIPVFDGPLDGSSDAPLSYVCVGWTPLGDVAGTIRTLPGVFGTRADTQEEGTFDVTCVSSAGYTDASTVRTTLRTIITDLDAAVYGLTDSTFAAYWCEIANFDLRQFQSPAGVTVEAVITFAYRVQQGA